MSVQSISALLHQAGIRFAVHDPGRRIQPPDSRQFTQFETGQAPWPLQ